MEKNDLVLKPHTSTSDLLTWSENPQIDASNKNSLVSGVRSTIRTNQPAGGFSKVMFGEQLTEEEKESLLKRKPCSGLKLREMTGSGIFESENENGERESANCTPYSNNRTGLRLYQQAASAISHISFGTEDNASPKKPVTLTEVAKQRELSGTLESESETKTKKQVSDAKCRELSGNDIFGPPPEVPPRSLAIRSMELKESKDIGEPAPRNLRTSVKVSNPAGGQSNIMFNDENVTKTAKKIHNQKFAELTGNDIFKGDATPGSVEKSLSVAKLREMSGSDIFADGKEASRDYWGGVRKPPGGESTISLV